MSSAFSFSWTRVLPFDAGNAEKRTRDRTKYLLNREERRTICFTVSVFSCDVSLYEKFRYQNRNLLRISSYSFCKSTASWFVSCALSVKISLKSRLMPKTVLFLVRARPDFISCYRVVLEMKVQSHLDCLHGNARRSWLEDATKSFVSSICGSFI